METNKEERDMMLEASYFLWSYTRRKRRGLLTDQVDVIIRAIYADTPSLQNSHDNTFPILF